jgi:hypothetical protein
LVSGPGAYTTARTHDNASCLMFWERHMKRLSESIQILSNLAPQLLFKSDNASTASLQPVSPNLPVWQPALKMLVNDSLEKILPVALKERVDAEELIITTLVSGNLEELNVCETISKEKMSKFFDVHVHIETYVPPQFGIRGNAEHLAVGGYGRNIAGAKYSDWVRSVYFAISIIIQILLSSSMLFLKFHISKNQPCLATACSAGVTSNY